MNHYEVMYVIDTMMDDEGRKALIERFNSLIAQNGGTVLRTDEWGKRNLAYPINYKTVGYYVLTYFDAPGTLPRELERNMKINENVLRYLVTVNDGVLPAKREFRPAGQPAAAATDAVNIAEATEAVEEKVEAAEEAVEAAAEAVTEAVEAAVEATAEAAAQE